LALRKPTPTARSVLLPTRMFDCFALGNNAVHISSILAFSINTSAMSVVLEQVEPDVDQLMRLMRSAVRYPGSAAKRGVQARLDVVARYHPHVVAAGLVARLKNIERELGAMDAQHGDPKASKKPT
jgi:hypothetical protein